MPIFSILLTTAAYVMYFIAYFVYTAKYITLFYYCYFRDVGPLTVLKTTGRELTQHTLH